ncbi:MAG: YafY family protein [Chloroflexi bacterium]|nr:YafY family protein [Chloroflexota bacterium]
MKQMDRRLRILTRLRTERAVRAADLAEDCECSIRTVYRDIDALCGAGIPVAATPGEGYRLVEGYHLPPIAFSAEEAAQLLRGADLATGLGTDDQERVRRSATSKLEAALPEATRREVELLRDRVRVERWDPRAPSEWLGPLLRATLEDRVVRIQYHSFRSDEVTERAVEPHHLTYYSDDWHIRGHCRLRDDGRDFRLARIRDVVVTDERFQRRPAFSRPHDGIPENDRPAVEVRVWLDRTAAPWAREDPQFGFLREEPAESGVVFAYAVIDWRRFLPIVLRWGAAARVIGPPEVVERFREEAEALSRVYARGL